MSRPVIGYRVVRAACDLLGRVDATKRAEQRTDYDEIMQAVHDLLEPLYPGTGSFVYPRRGPGSVMGDWLRWYRDAYELEARDGKRKCAYCVHDEHAGMCTGRNGGTAYPCPCFHSSCGVEARCAKCDGHGKLEGVDCDGCEGTGTR